MVQEMVIEPEDSLERVLLKKASGRMLPPRILHF